VYEYDYRQVLGWFSDLLVSDTARDYILQFSLTLSLSLSLTHTRTRAHTHTHTKCPQSRLHRPLQGSGFQRRTFPFLWVPELSPASATSFSQQQLTRTEPQQFSDWLTQSLTNQLLFTSLNSTDSDHTKHPLAVYGPLPSNGRCLVFWGRYLATGLNVTIHKYIAKVTRNAITPQEKTVFLPVVYY
jgi:hypothetical protein